MKISRIVATTAVALISVAGVSAPAVALEPVEVVDVAPQGSAPDLGVSNEELAALADTQSDAEIKAITESDEPAVLLMDDNGEVIAAALAQDPPKFSTKLHYDTVQGCLAAANACLYKTTGQQLGYKGTGSLSITAANVATVAAGSIQTKFTRNNGVVYTVPATKQARFTTAATITKITR